ncbi:Protein disulfide-isomerase [Venturia inaequalis]|nr:Protein disulfide-isomerase [Venturia inaequalis]
MSTSNILGPHHMAHLIAGDDAHQIWMALIADLQAQSSEANI